MRHAKNAVVVAAYTLAALDASAGVIDQSSIVGQPVIQVSAGEVAGCGIRLVSTADGPASTFRSIDASFNVYASNIAVMKAGTANFGVSAAGELTKPTYLPISDLWLKAPGDKPATAIGKGPMKAETPGYMLAAIKFESGLKLFDAVFEKKPLMIGVRVKAEPTDRVHSGVVQLSEPELQQVLDCVVALMETIQGKLDAAAK